MFEQKEKKRVKNSLLTTQQFVEKKCREFNKKGYTYEIYIDVNNIIYCVYEYLHKNIYLRRISSYDFNNNKIIGAKNCTYEMYKNVVINTMLAHGKDGRTLYIHNS